MDTTIVEKENCAACGVEVRENTQFCYNCGAPVNASGAACVVESADELSPESKAALDDLSEKLSSGSDAEKMAKAASERKQARVSRKRSAEFRWDHDNSEGGRFAILVSILIALFTAAAVYYTVFWRL